MKNLFEEVVQLTKTDAKINKANIGSHLNKLFEETGELAQGVNKIIGRKKTKETPKTIKENLLEEGVDSIQCIFAILATQGISYNDVKKKFKEKNKSYETFLGK